MDLKEKFHQWAPIRIFSRDSDVFVDWCWAGEQRFEQPFFDNTVEVLLRRPFNLAFRHETPIETLGELHSVDPGLRPDGFIFHMSRCGSTLVSQMLASLGQNIVISEASPIDRVLRAAADRERRIDMLRWLVSVYGRRRDAEEHFFIKFDSWSTLDIDLIAEAFPDVPWIFLYRDPVEVIVSHMRKRGSQMIPGSMEHVLPSLDLAASLQMPAEQYCARVLARICESAIAADRSNALFINYNRLPGAVFDHILGHFKVHYPAVDLQTMTAAAEMDAKTPSLPFVPDSESKRADASDTARTAAREFVEPLYQQIEKT